MNRLFEKVLNAAKKEGAENVELYMTESKRLELKAYKGALASINRAEVSGIGVRVISGGKVGYAFANNSSLAEKIARDAAIASKYTSGDPANVLPGPTPVEALDIYNKDLYEEPIDKKTSLLIDDEQEAVNFDNRIKPVDSIYGEEILRTHIINDLGVDYSYDSSHCWRYLRVLGEQDGEAQSGFSITLGRSLEELAKPAVFGKEASGRAINMLGAKKVSSKRCAIVLDSIVACQFLSLIGHAVSADAVLKGKSFLAGKMGQVIASSNFNLFDDGRLKMGPASAPVDDEGVATKKTTLISQGNLNEYLHNSYTAKKYGTEPTGNGFRGSYKSSPSVSPSNLYIGNGTLTKQELIETPQECFYVLDISGLHSGANPVNGEFSLGASGVWLKSGKKIHAVRETTISGDMLKFLSGIQAVADDLQFYPFGGGCGSPTLLISEMVLSGD